MGARRQNMAKEDLKLDILRQSIVRRISLGLNLLTLYPSHHPEVKAGIAMLVNTFDPFFLIEKEFLVGVSSKGWVVKDTDLSKENIQFGASARELHRRGISAIAFNEGVTSEIILKFFQLAALPFEKIEERGGLVKMVSEMPLPFINIYNLDYGKLSTSDAGGAYDRTEFFLNREALEKVICDYSGELVDGKKAAEVQSEEFAVAMNRIFKSGNEEKIKTLIKFLKELGIRCIREQVIRRRTKPQKFFELLSQLNSQLLQKVSVSLKMNEAGELRGESIEEGAYDPFKSRLLNLFNSFSLGSEGEPPDIREDSVREIRNLFEQNTEGEVGSSSTYKDFITNSVERTSQILHGDRRYAVRNENLLKEILPESIQKHITRILLDMLELEENPEDYLKIAGHLLPYFSLAVKTWDFPLLLEIFTFLDRHSSVKESEKIREQAAQSLDMLFNGNVVYEIIKRWIHSSDQDSMVLEKLLLRLNRGMVVTEMRLCLSETESEEEKSRIVVILPKLMSTDLAPLEEDIQGGEFSKILDAIRVIKMIRIERSAVLLGELLNHENPVICESAFDALVEHATQKSLEIVMGRILKLEGGQFEKALKAVASFGEQRIIHLFKPFLSSADWFGRSYSKRMRIIQSLGEMKNRHAVPLLAEIFNLSPFLWKGRNNSLRACVLNSLAKIGTQDAFNAVALLSQNGDTIIQLTGETLLEKSKPYE